MEHITKREENKRIQADERIQKIAQQARQSRLEYLRGEIIAERISYGEIAELQSMQKYIDKGDVLLLEWAGVPEFTN